MTFIAFFFSLTVIIPNFTMYEDSFLSSKLLSLNPKMHQLSDDIIDTYYNVIDVIDSFKEIEENGLTEEGIIAIKKIFGSNLVTENMIVKMINEMFANADINFDDIKIPEGKHLIDIKDEILENEIMQTLNELYDENILTDNIITRIVEENNIKIDPDEFISIFKD